MKSWPTASLPTLLTEICERLISRRLHNCKTTNFLNLYLHLTSTLTVIRYRQDFATKFLPIKLERWVDDIVKKFDDMCIFCATILTHYQRVTYRRTNGQAITRIKLHGYSKQRSSCTMHYKAVSKCVIEAGPIIASSTGERNYFTANSELRKPRIELLICAVSE